MCFFMSILISNYPGYNFSLLGFKGSVSLNDSVRSLWPEHHELTNEIALSILKKVKLKSDVLELLTNKKCVVIFFALAIAPVIHISLIGIALLLKYVPGNLICRAKFLLFLGLFVKEIPLVWLQNRGYKFLKTIEDLSIAYALQSLKCSQYIAAIKANPEIDLYIDE